MRTRRSVALVAAALLGACGGAPSEVPPTYAAVSLGGDSVSLPDGGGAAVLLNIWATWCVPCQRELPYLQRLHRAYADSGLRVVGVSIDKGSPAQVRDFLQRYGITYEIWHDPGERVLDAYPYMGLPATYLLGRDGRVAWRRFGELSPDDPEVERAIRDALRTGPAAREPWPKPHLQKAP